MAGEFSFCEINKQKAIRYHHNYGEFDFLLTQADDGSKDVQFYCSAPISAHAKQTIGFAALQHLERTAGVLKYSIKGDLPNFYDAVAILQRASRYLEKHGSTPKPTHLKSGA